MMNEQEIALSADPHQITLIDVGGGGALLGAVSCLGVWQVGRSAKLGQTGCFLDKEG